MVGFSQQTRDSLNEDTIMPIKTASYIKETTTYDDVLSALNQPEEIQKLIEASPEDSRAQIFDKLVLAVYGLQKDTGSEERVLPEGLGDFLAKDNQAATLIDALKVDGMIHQVKLIEALQMGDPEVILRRDILARMNEFTLNPNPPNEPGMFAAVWALASRNRVYSHRTQKLYFIQKIVNDIKAHYKKHGQDDPTALLSTSAMLQDSYNKSNNKFILEAVKIYRADGVTDLAYVNQSLRAQGMSDLQPKEPKQLELEAASYTKHPASTPSSDKELSVLVLLSPHPASEEFQEQLLEPLILPAEPTPAAIVLPPVTPPPTTSSLSSATSTSTTISSNAASTRVLPEAPKSAAGSGSTSSTKRLEEHPANIGSSPAAITESKPISTLPIQPNIGQEAPPKTEKESIGHRIAKFFRNLWKAFWNSLRKICGFKPKEETNGASGQQSIASVACEPSPPKVAPPPPAQSTAPAISQNKGPRSPSALLNGEVRPGGNQDSRVCRVQ